MGIAKRIAERRGKYPHPVEKFLESGETVKWMLPAQGGLHPFTMLFFALFILLAVLLLDPRSWVMGVTISVVIAITADHVLLLRARGWRPAKPVELLKRIERTAKFDVRSQFWSQIAVDGEKLWVHKRFQVKLNEADSSLGRGPAKTAPTGVYRANRAKKKVKNVRRKR